MRNRALSFLQDRGKICPNWEAPADWPGRTMYPMVRDTW